MLVRVVPLSGNTCQDIAEAYLLGGTQLNKGHCFPKMESGYPKDKVFVKSSKQKQIALIHF